MVSIIELLNLGNTNNQEDIDRYLDQNIKKYSENPSIANQFKALSGFKNSTMEDVRKNIINAYNVFEESTNPAFRNYIQTSITGGKKILSDIDKQRSLVEKYYGKGGEAETMINDYVKKYGDSLAAKSAQQQALAKSIGIKSGASESAIRAGVAQQQALDVDNLIKFQENKVNSLTNLYNQYNELISGLRAEASTANQAYILQPLATILDRQQQIATALVQNEAQLNSLRLTSGGGTATNAIDYLNNLMMMEEANKLMSQGGTEEETIKYLSGQGGQSLLPAGQQAIDKAKGSGVDLNKELSKLYSI